MTKTRIIVIVGFMIAFGAGAVVGLQLRAPSVVLATVPPPQQNSWLRTELGLSAEQNDQMKNIWESLHTGGRGYEDRRRQLRDQRDEAIAALLPPSVMGDYDKVLQEFSNKLTQLGQERDKAFQDAVEKTKKILTPEQRVKYEEFLKRREPDRGDRGPRGFGRRSDSRPVSRPPPE
jgi:Spy/CpxP family protein refolding chaperone